MHSGSSARRGGPSARRVPLRGYLDRSPVTNFAQTTPGHRGPHTGGKMVKLLVRDRETIQEAVRRFRKLVERSGIKKEMRRREYYEKPSEIKRRARLRAERRARRTRSMLAGR
jgi:small subunit ribosomal protein S21